MNERIRAPLVRKPRLRDREQFWFHLFNLPEFNHGSTFSRQLVAKTDVKV